MLSILIPTYNYNVYPLVDELYKQCKKNGINFDILVFDDASQLFQEENNRINTLQNCTYTILDKNIGRSAIRNLLAQKTSFKHLLFLDADVFPVSDCFIENYIKNISLEQDLIVGGICYLEQEPEKEQFLRWFYGHRRETTLAIERKLRPFKNFSSANFLVKKDTFLKIKFNETIKIYGHEDTLFAYDLEKTGGKILHIDNPVFHLGLETNYVFLEKSLLTVENAFYLKNRHLIDISYIKILSFYNKLEKFKIIIPIIYAIGKLGEPLIKKNLLSQNPSLKLLDFYKLHHLIKLERNA